jgi:hypothetical protein
MNFHLGKSMNCPMRLGLSETTCPQRLREQNLVKVVFVFYDSEPSRSYSCLCPLFLLVIAFRTQLCLYIMSCAFFYAGASIRACGSVGRHLVALEEDNELFSALLAPMVRSLAVSSPPKSQPTQRSQDPDGMEIVPSSSIKKRRASK